MVFHHVHEVGRFAAGHRSAHQFDGLALGVLDVGFGDVFIFEHLRQHAVARLSATLGMAVGDGVIVRRANDAGQEGAFRQRKLAHVFAEIGDAGFRKSANTKAAAIAEINFVGVQLKDRCLVKRCSSSRATMASATFRRQVRSLEKKKVRATCMVMVLAPW